MVLDTVLIQPTRRIVGPDQRLLQPVSSAFKVLERFFGISVLLHVAEYLYSVIACSRDARLHDKSV